ncbi:TniQ family protein [Pandoraea pneumonica]|uniref:TniQ family protein n=1 Tax=Pandoraea pneumonica TaxID=2508299 RepID=UPI003CF34C3C
MSSRGKTVARLLVRPAPMPDESMTGYLLRLAEGNGFGSLLDLDLLVSKTDRGDARTTLASLLIEPRLQALRGPVTHFRNLRIADSGGVDAQYWNGRRPRYCPVCLAQVPYWRAQWDLTLMVACPTHRVLLCDACPGCHRALSWKRRRVLECDCAQPLAVVRPEPASEALVSVGAYLSAALNPENVAASAYLQSDLRALSLTDLLALCAQFGAYFSPQGPKPTKMARLDEVAVAACVANGAGQVLLDWPRGFHSLLRDIGHRGSPAGAFSRMSARFGYFYTALYRRFGAPPFDFLRSEFEAFVAREWVGQLTERNRRMSLATRREHGWLPLTAAARSLKIRREAIRALIEDGSLEGQWRVSPAGRTWGTVSKRSVDALRESMGQWMTLTQARQVLGVSRKRAYALLRSGELRAVRGPTVDGSPVWRFVAREVAALSEALHKSGHD